MAKYNHAYAFAFSIDSDDPDGNDLTPEQLAKAAKQRVNDLLNTSGGVELIEALGPPYDTYKHQPEK